MLNSNREAKRFDSLNAQMPLTNDHFKRHSVTYEQSIVGTELFSFNSCSVHVRERNFGHFFKGNSVMNVNGTSVTFSQWTECKSLFIFSVRAEQILSREVTNFFLENTFFNCELSKMFIFHKKSCFAFFFWVKKGIIILYT